MPKEVVIYHNPRCTKSRQTLELLKSRGVSPTVVEYLKTPPTQTRIKQLIAMIGKSPLDVVRTKEAAYASSGLSAKSSKDAIAKAIAAEPILLERPIVVVGQKAAIGRPPENVLELLD